MGDLNAFNLVQQHFGQLESVIQNHGGVVIKTIGDAVMATFLSPVDAVRAAIQLQEQLHGRTAGGAPGLQLKVGVHSGPSIAVTQNDRLDYFGQTVNIAARVEAMANATEICMTEDVFAVSSVPDLLRGFTVTTQMAHLKGSAKRNEGLSGRTFPIALPRFRSRGNSGGSFADHVRSRCVEGCAGSSVGGRVARHALAP
ncbi:MAG: adenylate/guanylate cyclase domain-containing protein [Spirochaetales bacterium]|nr:adenylate/guanylate cyclase domain-containing protein [Spirochaetales bacterium]